MKSENHKNKHNDDDNNNGNDNVAWLVAHAASSACATTGDGLQRGPSLMDCISCLMRGLSNPLTTTTTTTTTTRTNDNDNNDSGHRLGRGGLCGIRPLWRRYYQLLDCWRGLSNPVSDELIN